MVAWRSLIQGLFVEALRFGFAHWGQESGSDFKGPIRESRWHCEQKQSFWEAEARNCTEKLQALASCGAEIAIYKEQLKVIPRCSNHEAFLLGVLSGATAVIGVLCLAFLFLLRGPLHRRTLGLNRESDQGERFPDSLVEVPAESRDGVSLAAARQRARSLRG